MLCCLKFFATTRVFSGQNSVSHCPASFCTQRPNLPFTPDISRLSVFSFQSSTMKMTFFFSFFVFILKGSVGLQAAAASHFSCVQFVQPHRQQPTRLPRLWDSLDKNTGVGCHFLLQCMKVKSESEVSQSCPTLSDPMDWSTQGSSVHGIFQARGLEWAAIAFSSRSS